MSSPNATRAGPVPPGWHLRDVLPTWPQFATVSGLALLAAVVLNGVVRDPFASLLSETTFIAMLMLLSFRLAGAWPQTLMPRWVAQVLAVGFGAFFFPLLVQLFYVGGSFSMFVNSRPLVGGYRLLTVGTVVVGTLITLAALFRERDAQARAAALGFALERETLQRQAADARLHLLTAQIEPHFLLNTLANVQELVESGSPRAAPVFRSLIAYLRAAMPQLQHEAATLGDEERLVRSYLELMLMRMPDRLRFSVDIEPALRTLRFPPMALLTLVENAVRHGIDPAEGGGEIEVGARAVEGGVRGTRAASVWVSDTGVGLSEQPGHGTGLANLQARLKAFFGDGARFEISERQPSGVRVDLRLPIASA